MYDHDDDDDDDDDTNLLIYIAQLSIVFFL